jgi:hypothetical protein
MGESWQTALSFVRQLPRRGLLLAGLILVAPVDANAQEAIESVLAQLRRGTLVRVRTEDGERIEAPIRAVERDSISLRLRYSVMRLGVARIDSL